MALPSQGESRPDRQSVHRDLDIVHIVPIHKPSHQHVENILRISKAAPVVAVDDGSGSEFDGIVSLLESAVDVEVVRLPSNMGIGHALNVGVEWARVHCAPSSLLFFDQDSTPKEGYSARVVDALSRLDGLVLVGPGSVAGRAQRRARGAGPTLVRVNTLIQSGMACSLSTWMSLGPFRSDYFIDAVDTEYCLRAMTCGGSVWAVRDLDLPHTLGESRSEQRWRRLFGRDVEVTGHPDWRRYYIVRNNILLLRQYGFRVPGLSLRCALRCAQFVIVGLIFSEGRLGQLRAIVRGARDGIMGSSGPLRR